MQDLAELAYFFLKRLTSPPVSEPKPSTASNGSGVAVWGRFPDCPPLLFAAFWVLCSPLLGALGVAFSLVPVVFDVLFWDATSLLEGLDVVDCGAAFEAISLLLVDGSGVVAAAAVELLADDVVLSGAAGDGAAADGAAVEDAAFAAEVFGLLVSMCPGVTSVPAAVFPAVPVVAGPGLAFAITSSPAG